MNQTTEIAVREESDEALVAFSAVGIGIETAQVIANRLDDIIRKKNLFTPIQGKDHINVEAWCACAGMCGLSPRTAWSRRITDQEGVVVGYESRVEVVRISTNDVVGAAESECWLDEKLKNNLRWKDRFAAKGMSQTRATSRAIAQILRWIPVLAGYEGTPAEEMGEEGLSRIDNPSQRANAPRAQPRGRRIEAFDLTALWNDWKAEMCRQQKHPDDINGDGFTAFIERHTQRKFNTRTAAEWTERDYICVKKAIEGGLS